jgi:hypothetical protein
MYPRNWQRLILSWLLLALASPGLQADWRPRDRDLIDLEVVTERGRELPQYPVDLGGPNYRAYLEARRAAEYGLRVRNRSGERIGLVIAVDGRNILNGEFSEMGPDEPMYVLGPHERAEYDGWRTGRDRVHRFYFTDAGDSYAAAWGDHSAMGVISVAVYRERKTEAGVYRPRRKHRAEGTGTGFGDEAGSPSRRVDFAPRRHASAEYFLKYEWPRTLCRLGVSDECRGRGNRFWPGDEGYAAYPPGFFRP